MDKFLLCVSFMNNKKSVVIFSHSFSFHFMLETKTQNEKTHKTFSNKKTLMLFYQNEHKRYFVFITKLIYQHLQK